MIRALMVLSFTAACGKESPPSPAPPTKPEAAPGESIVAVPLAADVLPGWTLRSAQEGWWSKAGDEQLYVSTVDLGTVGAGKSAQDRAQLVADMFREANRRNGGATLAVTPDPSLVHAERAVACITVVSAKDHTHGFACGFARSSAVPIGIEYYNYSDIALDAFHARARELVAKLADAAERH